MAAKRRRLRWNSSKILLPLEDSRWSELSHAYGSGSDIPSLLKRLKSATEPAEDYKAEPWFTLWSSLCHQGDVYTASYAAVPHVVDIARQAVGPIAFSFFDFPAAIEVARRKGHGPEIPSDLADDYTAAIASLSDIGCLHSKSAWDRSTVLSAAAAQAVAKGHVDIAEAILNLDDDWISKIIASDWE